MRRHGILLMLIVVTALAWVASATAITKPQTFSLLEVSSNNDIPLGDFAFDRPPTSGDEFAFANKLYTWAGTKKGALAGHDSGVGTFITGFGPDFSHKARALFVAQAFLRGGNLLIQGFGQINPDGPSSFTFPIVGGTGIYANARGYLNVRDLGDGNQGKSNLEFHLMP